ncbi:MAG: glycerophosphodiester phosphodiesterase, partial [Candidatus Methylomirabilis sp.]|nr:glycerophosphodiester phosphodiesterase [Deltaproteobacteria bacterium]
FTRDGGATFPYRGTGLEIPTLDEAFARFPAERFLIEIKQAAPPIEAEVLDAIARAGMHARVCLASFDDAVVARVRALDPEMCTSAGVLEVIDLALRPVEDLLRDGVKAEAVQLPPDVLGAPLVTAPLVAKLAALGIETHVWTIDDADEMRALLDLGVEGIITDRPDVLRDVIASR